MEELKRKAAILPDDPLERALFFLVQKDSLIAEKTRLEGLLAEIIKKLELINEIGKKIGEISSLLN